MKGIPLMGSSEQAADLLSPCLELERPGPLMHLRKQSIVKARLVPSYAGEHKGEREPDDTLSNFSGWTIVLRLRDLSKVTQLLNQQDRKSLPLSAVYRHGRLVFKWQMAVFLMKASLSNKEK